MLLNIVAVFGLVAAAATPKSEVSSALAQEEAVEVVDATLTEEAVEELLPEEVAQVEDELLQEEAEILN